MKYFILYIQPLKMELIELYIQPLKMELIEGSETSANLNRTPGKYPKEYIQDSKHGESLKPRKLQHTLSKMCMCVELKYILFIKIAGNV
jgi:hypothetical protein